MKTYYDDADYSKVKLIDGNAWIRRLLEEKEETKNEKRKTYLQIMINSIECQPNVDKETALKYAESLKK